MAKFSKTKVVFLLVLVHLTAFWIYHSCYILLRAKMKSSSLEKNRFDVNIKKNPMSLKELNTATAILLSMNDSSSATSNIFTRGTKSWTENREGSEAEIPSQLTSMDSHPVAKEIHRTIKKKLSPNMDNRTMYNQSLTVHNHSSGMVNDATRGRDPVIGVKWHMSSEDKANFLAERKEVYIQRRKKVEEVCQKYGKTLRLPGFSQELLWDRQRQLAWCRNAKTGVTTWVRNFLKIKNISGDISNPVALFQDVPKMFPSPITITELQSCLDFAFKFTSVRHPFERLVSAYRDKMIDSSSKNNYYIIIQENIIKTYGMNSSKGLQRWPTFVQFIQFVLSQFKGCTERCFVNTVDVHWKPFYARCGFCDIDYDVIMKMETFSDDQKYVILRTNLEDVLDISWENKNRGESSAKLALQYFSQLSETQIMQLYGIYKADFEMFGYSIDEYMSNIENYTL